MRLCLQAGRLDYNRALSEITGKELGRWRKFFDAEPFGGPHDDYRFGLLVSLLYHANRGKGQPSLPLSHWFPTLKTAVEVDAEQQAAMVRAWAMAGAA